MRMISPRSDKKSALYSYSAWAALCLGAFMVLALTPWFKQIESASVGRLVLQVLGGGVGLVGVPASMIILVGMAVHCAHEDRSSTNVKIFWFLAFVVTGMFGAAAYYFTVYKRVPRGPSRPLPGTDALIPHGSEICSDTPDSHDHGIRVSRLATAKPGDEDEMNRITSIMLHAKHWQIFLCLAAPPLIMEVLGLGMMSTSVSSWHNLTLRDCFLIGFWVLIPICFLAWLMAIGLSLQSIGTRELRMKSKLFTSSALLAAISLFMYVPNEVVKVSPFRPIVAPLAFVYAICVIYMIHFVSKSVAEAERGKRVSFEQYVGLFFLLCLFPVGIWVIQPKINRLQRGARSPEVG